jgi:hypothetical protein
MADFQDDLPPQWSEALRARKAAIESLRSEIAVGLQQIEQGLSSPLDLEAFKIEARQRLAEEHG